MGSCQTIYCNKEIDYGLKTHQKSENNVDEGNPEFEDSNIQITHHSLQKDKDKFQEGHLLLESELTKKNNQPKDSNCISNQKDHEQIIKNETMSDVRIKLGAKILDKGAIYEGEWLKGKRDGTGKQVWPDGSIYEGQWVEDHCCGKGKLINEDGDIYEGDWLEDQANGFGIYQLINGVKYEG